MNLRLRYFIVSGISLAAAVGCFSTGILLGPFMSQRGLESISPIAVVGGIACAVLVPALAVKKFLVDYW